MATDEERNKLVQEILDRGPEGRRQLASSMVTPIERLLEYQLIALRVFHRGEIDKPDEGWACNLDVTLRDRPDLWKHVDKLREKIALQLRDGFARELISWFEGQPGAQDPQEEWDWKPHPPRGSHLVMNVLTYKDWAVDPRFRDWFDGTTMREILRTGFFGDFKGAGVLVNNAVEPGVIYACGPPESMGICQLQLSIEPVEKMEPRGVQADPDEKGVLFDLAVRAMIGYKRPSEPPPVKAFRYKPPVTTESEQD